MAGLLVADCLRHIKHALGAQALSPELLELDVLNDAGEYLVTMHAWEWLVRGEADVDLVSGQDWAAIPTDCRDIRSVRYSENLSHSFQWVSQDRMNHLRQNVEPTWRYFGVIEYIEPAAGGPVVPRIALYPTPGSSVTGAFSIRYAAGWTDVGRDANLDTEKLLIPKQYGPLMKRLCRIFAAGYEMEDEAPLEERLQGLENSAMLDRFKERDGELAGELGESEGGAVFAGRYVRNWDGGDNVGIT